MLPDFAHGERHHGAGKHAARGGADHRREAVAVVRVERRPLRRLVPERELRLHELERDVDVGVVRPQEPDL